MSGIAEVERQPVGASWHSQRVSSRRTLALRHVVAAARAHEHAAGHRHSTDRILAGAHRSEANRARDEYRHPKETLLFFGLRPEMKVLEIWPDPSGWYTEVIAPLVREQGQVLRRRARCRDPASELRTSASPTIQREARGNARDLYDKRRGRHALAKAARHRAARLARHGRHVPQHPQLDGARLGAAKRSRRCTRR